MHTHFGERPSHARRFEMIETKALRRRMEAAIETLIATLDALDGEQDLEPSEDDEDGADREEACEDEGCDGGDRESDMAEWGAADLDALADPELGFGCSQLAFYGSGEEVAAAMLQRRGIAR